MVRHLSEAEIARALRMQGEGKTPIEIHKALVDWNPPCVEYVLYHIKYVCAATKLSKYIYIYI